MRRPYSIAICGNSHQETPETIRASRKLVEALASVPSTLLVTSQSGLPRLATMHAVKAGIPTTMISAARNRSEHVRMFDEAIDLPHSVIFSGFGRPGADRMIMRSVDAVLFTDEDLHTSRQLSFALEEGKPIGVVSDNPWHHNHSSKARQAVFYSKNPLEIIEHFHSVLQD